jgi:hypothetical protein
MFKKFGNLCIVLGLFDPHIHSLQKCATTLIIGYNLLELNLTRSTLMLIQSYLISVDMHNVWIFWDRSRM